MTMSNYKPLPQLELLEFTVMVDEGEDGVLYGLMRELGCSSLRSAYENYKGRGMDRDLKKYVDGDLE